MHSAPYFWTRRRWQAGRARAELAVRRPRLSPLLLRLALSTVIQYRSWWGLVRECLEVINKMLQENRIMWIKKRKRKPEHHSWPYSTTVLGRASLRSQTNTFSRPESACRHGQPQTPITPSLRLFCVFMFSAGLGPGGSGSIWMQDSSSTRHRKEARG